MSGLNKQANFKKILGRGAPIPTADGEGAGGDISSRRGPRRSPPQNFKFRCTVQNKVT